MTLDILHADSFRPKLSSKVKVTGQSSRSQEENVVKMISVS